MVMHEILQDKVTGILTVKPTDALQNYYNKPQAVTEVKTYECRLTGEKPYYQMESQMLGAVLFKAPEDCFSMEIDFEISQAHEFGIELHVDEGMKKGYFLKMDAVKGQVVWDLWPRSPKGLYQWQIKGDVAYQVKTQRRLPKGKKYHILAVREKDICVV